MSYCTNCGKEIENGRFLCDECMEKPEQNEEVSENIAEETESEAPGEVQSEVYEAPEEHKEPRATAKKRDLLLASLLIVPSFLIVNSLFFGKIGLGISIGALVIAIVSLWYIIGEKKAMPSGYAAASSLLLLLSSVSLTLSDDNLSKVLSLFMILTLYLVILCEYFGLRSRRAGSYRAFSDVLTMLFKNGFGEIGGACFALLRRTDDEGNITKRRTGNVFAGVALAVPVLFVVVPLLISSDAAFESMFKKFPFDNLFEMIFTVGIGTLYLLILFGRLFRIKSLTPPEQKAPWQGGVDPIMVCSFLAVISAVYVVYLFSQLAYFFSAFSGLLPEDFTVAAYARRGFFEMCAVCAINLLIIFMSSVLCKKGEKGLPSLVKAPCLFLGVFSLILIGTAISKMVLYIGSFGMTRLRIYTSVFMIFLAVVFLAVIARLFVSRLPYMKIILISAGLVMLVTCVADADRVIANYNVNAYLSGKLDTVDVDTLAKLNDSATGALLRLHEKADEPIKRQAANVLNRRLSEHYDITYNNDGTIEFKRKNNDIFDINLTEENAIKLLFENKEQFGVQSYIADEPGFEYNF